MIEERKIELAELTVSMPAYNTGRYIGAAIESVLRQRGVDFELIVVDDASTDNTAKVASSFKDPRVKVVRNSINRGVSFCHNLVLAQSASPFIAHVDSDDLLLPNALKKMVATLGSDPHIGQAHCYFFDINEAGKTTRQAFCARKKQFLKDRPRDMDYKRELPIRGCVINHLRTYRREVFDKVGYFNEKLRIAEDFEMALRILDKFRIQLVPEFLYCLRLHPTSTTNRSGKTSFAFLLQRWMICRRLARTGQVKFWNEKQYDLNKLMAQSLHKFLQDLIFS